MRTLRNTCIIIIYFRKNSIIFSLRYSSSGGLYLVHGIHVPYSSYHLHHARLIRTALKTQYNNDVGGVDTGSGAWDGQCVGEGGREEAEEGRHGSAGVRYVQCWEEGTYSCDGWVCLLHAACCTLHTACCTVPAVRCTVPCYMNAFNNVKHLQLTWKLSLVNLYIEPPFNDLCSAWDGIELCLIKIFSTC